MVNTVLIKRQELKSGLASRRKVILESPYAGDRKKNLLYLDECIRDSIKRGEAPFASHQMYTNAMNDLIEVERQCGIECGYFWWSVADCIVFYADLGVSPGMRKALERCHYLSYPFEMRYMR